VRLPAGAGGQIVMVGRGNKMYMMFNQNALNLLARAALFLLSVALIKYSMDESGPFLRVAFFFCRETFT
jgi:hypothetical protein